MKRGSGHPQALIYAAAHSASASKRTVTKPDQAAILVLTEAVRVIAVANGPISSRAAAGMLLALSGIIRERRATISMSVLEAMMGLVVALKEDITA